MQPAALSRMRAEHRGPRVTFRKSYRVSSRSKRSSRAPSPTTAWKPSSGSFVFRESHATAVPPPSPHAAYATTASTGYGRCYPLITSPRVMSKPPWTHLRTPSHTSFRGLIPIAADSAMPSMSAPRCCVRHESESDPQEKTTSIRKQTSLGKPTVGDSRESAGRRQEPSGSCAS